MTQLARRWSLTSIGTVMLGATALSGPAFAQAQDRGGFDLHRHFAQNFTPDHRGGGGGGGSGGGWCRGGGSTTTDADVSRSDGRPAGGYGTVSGRGPVEVLVFTRCNDLFGRFVDGFPNTCATGL